MKTIGIVCFISLLSATCGAIDPPEKSFSDLKNIKEIRQQLPQWYQGLADSEIIEITSRVLSFEEFEKKHPFNYSFREERTFARKHYIKIFDSVPKDQKNIFFDLLVQVERLHLYRKDYYESMLWCLDEKEGNKLIPVLKEILKFDEQINGIKFKPILPSSKKFNFFRYLGRYLPKMAQREWAEFTALTEQILANKFFKLTHPDYCVPIMESLSLVKPSQRRHFYNNLLAIFQGPLIFKNNKNILGAIARIEPSGFEEMIPCLNQFFANEEEGVPLNSFANLMEAFNKINSNEWSVFVDFLKQINQLGGNRYVLFLSNGYLDPPLIWRLSDLSTLERTQFLQQMNTLYENVQFYDEAGFIYKNHHMKLIVPHPPEEWALIIGAITQFYQGQTEPVTWDVVEYILKGLKALPNPADWCEAIEQAHMLLFHLPDVSTYNRANELNKVYVFEHLLALKDLEAIRQWVPLLITISQQLIWRGYTNFYQIIALAPGTELKDWGDFTRSLGSTPIKIDRFKEQLMDYIESKLETEGKPIPWKIKEEEDD